MAVCDSILYKQRHDAGAVSPLHSPERWRAVSCDTPSGKEGCPMVSFTDLIEIGILIVGIISLFIQASKK